MSLPEQTRRESMLETYKTVVTVSQQIYRIVLHKGPISAWDISREMNRDVYTIRPRLTELFHEGKIKDCGTRFEHCTNRLETLWEVVDHQMRLC